MKKLLSKAAALRFLKKTVIFCIGYVITYSIAMIVIFCMKGEYPELLTTVTFAYFGIDCIVSGGIKISETFGVKRKSKEVECYEPAQPEEENKS